MIPPARPSRGVERRERILDAVRDAIVTEGPDGVRMRGLAERCGVAVATLYNQFGSRDALIAAALERDFRGRYEPLSRRTVNATPPEQLRRRIVQAGRDIRRMREYTAAVLAAFFRPSIDPTFRAVVHDFVAADFRGIVDHIGDAGDLLDWVDREAFASDVVTQLYAISVSWVQGAIPAGDLVSRLLRCAAIAFAGISRGETRSGFEALARDAARPHGARRPKAAAAASRPAIRP